MQEAENSLAANRGTADALGQVNERATTAASVTGLDAGRHTDLDAGETGPAFESRQGRPPIRCGTSALPQLRGKLSYPSGAAWLGLRLTDAVEKRG